METPKETSVRKRRYWRRARWCNFIGTALGVLVMAPLLIMLFDRREPITILPGKIDPYYVKNGMTVVVTWPLIEHRACAGDLRRVVVDQGGKGKIHEFAVEPTIYHQVLSPDARTFSKNMTMPYGMAPGPAIYYGIGTRWCNVLQQFIWPIPFRSPDIPICILPSEGQPSVQCSHGEP